MVTAARQIRVSVIFFILLSDCAAARATKGETWRTSPPDVFIPAIAKNISAVNPRAACDRCCQRDRSFDTSAGDLLFRSTAAEGNRSIMFTSGKNDEAASQRMELYCMKHPGTPSAVRSPKLFFKSGTWVALLGDNIEDGIDRKSVV